MLVTLTLACTNQPPRDTLPSYDYPWLATLLHFRDVDKCTYYTFSSGIELDHITKSRTEGGGKYLNQQNNVNKKRQVDKTSVSKL